MVAEEIIISLELQSDILNALEKNGIEEWCNENQKLLDCISNSIKMLKINRSDREKEQVCTYICQYFLTLFEILSKNEVKTQKIIAESTVDQMLLKLMAARDSKKWQTFYNYYENYFDNVIHLARNQRKLDIKVETIDKMMCTSFHKAKEINDRIKSLKTERIENITVENTVPENMIRKLNKHKDTQWSISNFLSCCGNNAMRFKQDDRNEQINKIITEQPTRESNQGHQVDASNDVDAVSLPDAQSLFEETCNKQNKNINSEEKMEELIEEFKKQLNQITSMESNQNEIRCKQNIKKEESESPKVHRSPSIVSNTSSDFSFRRNAMESSFQRKLNAQNEMFSEILRKIKAKRERLNQEAEEEMRKFRIESAKRIQIFLKCINLKIKWEEQEKEWSDWLKYARDPLIKVKTQFMEFDGIRRYDDEDEIRSELLFFQKCVQVAYDKLVFDFGNLTMLSDKYENKLFLKVIQKSISVMATKLCYLMEQLDQFQNDIQFYSLVNELASTIDSMEIPTTSKLRFICETASEKDYQFVAPPKQPKSYCVITEI